MGLLFAIGLGYHMPGGITTSVCGVARVAPQMAGVGLRTLAAQMSSLA